MPSLTRIPVSDLRFLGRDLHRPECVLGGRDGTLYASDWRGGVVLLGSDGTHRSILPRENPRRVQPNGIAVDGLGYTNEVQVRPERDWLYVNETFGRRLFRFPLVGQGRLGERETVATFGAGTFPDGLTFDAESGSRPRRVLCPPLSTVRVRCFG